MGEGAEAGCLRSLGCISFDPCLAARGHVRETMWTRRGCSTDNQYEALEHTASSRASSQPNVSLACKQALCERV